MQTARPVEFEWDGEVMRPRYPKLADREYAVGERVSLAPYLGRSELSHKHEFAWLKEAWANLPEDIADEFPTPEHLRKRALIAAGYYREEIIDASTNAAALRVAGYAKRKDEFAVTVVRGPIVVIREAESQSRRAMGAKRFQESKTAIMEVIADMIGVTPAELERAAA